MPWIWTKKHKSNPIPNWTQASSILRALDVHLLSRFNSVLKYILWWNSGYNYIYSLKSNLIVRWLGASVTWINYKMRLYSVRYNKIVTFGPDRIPFWTLYYGTDAPSSYTLSLRVRKWNSSHTQSSPQSVCPENPTTFATGPTYRASPPYNPWTRVFSDLLWYFSISLARMPMFFLISP